MFVDGRLSKFCYIHMGLDGGNAVIWDNTPILWICLKTEMKFPSPFCCLVVEMGRHFHDISGGLGAGNGRKSKPPLAASATSTQNPSIQATPHQHMGKIDVSGATIFPPKPPSEWCDVVSQCQLLGRMWGEIPASRSTAGAKESMMGS